MLRKYQRKECGEGLNKDVEYTERRNGGKEGERERERERERGFKKNFVKKGNGETTKRRGMRDE
jgi:hypothetical protein